MHRLIRALKNFSEVCPLPVIHIDYLESYRQTLVGAVTRDLLILLLKVMYSIERSVDDYRGRFNISPLFLIRLISSNQADHQP